MPFLSQTTFKSFAALLAELHLKEIPQDLEASGLYSVYLAELDRALVHDWGCNWADLSGEKNRVLNAISAGQDPKDFSEEFGQKYDLDPIV